MEFSGKIAQGEFPMKRSRYSENQIILILKEAEAGVPVTDLCRTYGFSKSSYYKWKAKYGGMEVSDLRRLRELEASTSSRSATTSTSAARASRWQPGSDRTRSASTG